MLYFKFVYITSFNYVNINIHAMEILRVIEYKLMMCLLEDLGNENERMRMKPMFI